MKSSQLNIKLNHKKVGSFIIKKKKNKMNYKLELLNKIRVYPVFHMSLLEPTDLRILLVTKKSSKLAQDDEYEVKRIINYNLRTKRYIIK